MKKYFIIALLLFFCIALGFIILNLNVYADLSNREQAIQKGVDWLIARQADNGGWEPHSMIVSNSLAIILSITYITDR